MKKWITSNYHYLVPEIDETTTIDPDFAFFLADVKRGVEFLGKDKASPVVVGPVTMAYLANSSNRGGSALKNVRLSLVEKLVPVYRSLLLQLNEMGVTEIQVHEAALVFEDPSLLPMFSKAYPAILVGNKASINVVSFMEDVGKEHYKWLISVDEFRIVSLDFTRGDTLGLIREFGFPSSKVLGAGLVDTRSVWRVDPSSLEATLKDLTNLVATIRIQPSGSLQYTPWDLSCEKEILDHPAGGVLAFAAQKLEEVSLVAKAIRDPSALEIVRSAWEKYRFFVQTDKSVSDRMKALTEEDFHRAEPFSARRSKQLKGALLSTKN